MPLLPGEGRGKGSLRQVPQLLLFRGPLGTQEQSAQGMAQCLVAQSVVTVATGSLGKGSMDLVYLGSRFRDRMWIWVGTTEGLSRKESLGPRRLRIWVQWGDGSLMWYEGARMLKASSSQPQVQTWAWEYLRQTTAMTTTATMKTSPAVAEPTMRGSCSWSCWALEPRDGEGTGEQKDEKYGPGQE